MRGNHVLSIVVVAAAVGIPATVAAAVSWTAWVSEEGGGPWAYCGPSNEAASGFQCSGSYCDDVRMKCETMPYGITVTGYHASATFSEENNGIGTVTSEGWYRYDNSYSEVCNYSGSAGIVTGVRCTGSNCDNITLECATPMTHVEGVAEPAQLTNCAWTGWFSEEQAAMQYATGANKWITGVACSGSYCDNKSFYVCSLAAPPDSCVGQCGGYSAGGCWCDSACSTYGDCCSDYDYECT